MLVAILLVALGTIVAAAVAYESAMAARRGTATFAFDEALLVGQGSEALAAFGIRAVLQNTRTSAGSSADVFLGQQWAQPLGPIEVVPGVTLEASLEDMQGRFNLNWLVDSGSSPFGNPNQGNQNNSSTANNGLGRQNQNGLAASNPAIGPSLGLGAPNAGAIKAFNKLLESVGVEPKWADQIVDWIDSDNIPQPQGAEDSLYLGQNPPYLAANRYLTSVSELLALPGFKRENYEKLLPYITALPPATPLNICTAPGKVLDAFSTQTNWQDEAELAKLRSQANGCFPTLTTYTQQNLESQDLQLAGAKRFGTTSSYFRLSSLITIGTTEFNLYSLLYVEPNSYAAHPVQRSFSPD
jgi:general secretion pathway protein K